MICPNCKDWKKYIKRLNAPETFIQLTRSYLMKPYPKKGMFRFCPWCGTKLVEEGKKDNE